MKCILDSAVFINASGFPFTSKKDYVISPSCVSEVKEALAKTRLDAALNEHHVRIVEASPSFIRVAKELAETHGILRLSHTDLEVVALGLEAVSNKEKVYVCTDDYSIQNVLKWAKVPFEGILQSGIQKKRSFRT